MENPNVWTVSTFFTAFLSTIYNVAMSFVLGVKSLGLHEWLAILGLLVAVATSITNRHYSRKREMREAERHEWERQAFFAKLAEEDDCG